MQSTENSPVGVQVAPRPHPPARDSALDLTRPARQRVIGVLCPGSLHAGRSGGIGSSVANVVEQMQSAAPDFRLVVIDTRGDGHIAWSPFYLLGAAVRILALSISRGVPLLHVNLSAHGSAARKLVLVALAAALRIPIVIQLHGAVFDEFYLGLPPVGRAALRWMLKRAAHLVVLGEHWRHFLVETMAIAPERISIIANGVAAPPPREAPRKEPALLLFLGRLEPRKGVSELIAALAAPALRDRSWAAVLAGDGDATPYRDQARRLGIDARISFPGWLGPTAIARHLNEATCLVLPSYAEALPMAVIEALAHGVPVITTPVGSLPDYLVDGRSVLFVPPGDIGGLSQAIERVLASAPLRDQLADGGQQVFADHFDVRTVAARLVEVYRNVGIPALRR